VVLADALEMKGVSARHDPADAAVLAVEAGCDALIVGHDLGEEATESVVAALAARVDPGRLADAARRVDVLAANATLTPARVDRSLLTGAAGRALVIDGDVSFERAPSIVELRPVANIAAGEAAHGLADTIVREGGEIPDADVYVVHDVHRHPWMRAADRPGAVIIETGLPVWHPEHARGHISTFGNGSRSLAAAAELIA
jgi:beta-N-acetylhexosaminidase